MYSSFTAVTRSLIDFVPTEKISNGSDAHQSETTSSEHPMWRALSVLVQCDLIALDELCKWNESIKGRIPLSDYFERSIFFFPGIQGEVYVCGGNTFGQIGLGSTQKATMPVKLEALSQPVRMIAAGYFMSVSFYKFKPIVWQIFNNSYWRSDIYPTWNEKGRHEN